MGSSCFLILIGLPGAGKSTLARSICDVTAVKFNEEQPCSSPQCCDVEAMSRHRLGDHESKRCHMIHIQYDDFLDRSTASDLITNCEEGWKNYRKEIMKYLEFKMKSRYQPLTLNTDLECDVIVCDKLKKQLKRSAPMSCGCPCIYIIDDNMHLSSMRYSYFQLAKKYSAAFCQVYIACDLNLAQQRNKERANMVTEEEISRMSLKLEPPDSTRAWEKHSLCIDPEETMKRSVIEQVLSLIEEALGDPVIDHSSELEMEKRESRGITSANLVHQSDQWLRKLVADYMRDERGKNYSKQELSDHAAAANACRLELLDELKSGRLSLSDWLPESKNTDANIVCIKDLIGQMFQEKMTS